MMMMMMYKDHVFESDIDTRRRSACDLVKALSKQFEGPVIQNFSQYVQAMLQVRTISDVLVMSVSLKAQLWYMQFCFVFEGVLTKPSYKLEK